MTVPINLNHARKIRARAQKTKQANENVEKYGRSKADRVLAATKTSKATAMLDQHKLEDDN